MGRSAWSHRAGAGSGEGPASPPGELRSKWWVREVGLSNQCENCCGLESQAVAGLAEVRSRRVFTTLAPRRGFLTPGADVRLLECKPASERSSPSPAAPTSSPGSAHLSGAPAPARRAAGGRGRVSLPPEEAHWPLAGAGRCLVPGEGARAGGGNCDRGYGVVTLGRRRRGGGERAAEQPCNRRWAGEGKWAGARTALWEGDLPGRAGGESPASVWSGVSNGGGEMWQGCGEGRGQETPRETRDLWFERAKWRPLEVPGEKAADSPN